MAAKRQSPEERQPIRERFATFQEAKAFAEAIPAVATVEQGWRGHWKGGPYDSRWWLAVGEGGDVLATITKYGNRRWPWHVDEGSLDEAQPIRETPREGMARLLRQIANEALGVATAAGDTLGVRSLYEVEQDAIKSITRLRHFPDAARVAKQARERFEKYIANQTGGMKQ